MNAPYLQEFKKISGFTVWIVDGTYIRDNIDIEFTNFGQHLRFDFIPDNEFWIDKEYAPGEEHFFITHMLAEHRLMTGGKSYDDALDEADREELDERMKSKKMMEIKNQGFENDIIQLVHKELLAEYGDVNVWIVDGELVRSALYICFTEGGHDKVYAFVPENEIWIDDDLSPEERKFVLLHELYERNLMLKNWSYYVEEEQQLKHRRGNRFKSAHTAASALELVCRKNPAMLEEKFNEEVEKASKKVPLLVASK
ncbi:hypothetical protein JW756_03170 [Candidatus Woesearchaeota archaeon]|nr:hypothetical protein [Candidatus Woesearchaeota archaeon]